MTATAEVLLTSRPSAHAVRYELLVSADPYNLAYYDLVAEANEPPTVPLDLSTLPYEPVWATIRVRNAFDATIHADPVRLDHEHWPVENVTQGYRYLSKEAAELHAALGDVILESR